MRPAFRLLGLSIGFLFTTCILAEDEGFKPIFDGKALKGWDGNPELWRVDDGAITGQTTPEKPTKGNTFLIWREGSTVDDFELKLEYRIVGGNSGVQYRSFEAEEKWVVGGYQADIDLEQVACELSFDRRADLQSRIRDSKRLRDLGLGTLAEGDVIKLAVWDKAASNPSSSSANNGWNPARASLFQVVADELGLGTPVTP